jgi:beta-glucanase (GH16 family)
MKQIIVFAALLLSGFISTAQEDSSYKPFFEDFSDSVSKFFHYGSTGNKAAFKCTLGVNSGSERKTKVISFKIDPNDSAGAGRGPEILSNNFTHFGTYSARLKVPDVRNIQPNTGAVVGYFTYFMDSVFGLSEIDFEWLVADPTIIYIGTWTGFDGKLQRIGRTINLAKGVIYNTVYKENHTGQSSPLTGIQNQPEMIPAIEGYDASSKFYTYGFDWYHNRLRWWMIHPKNGKKIILWDYQGSLLGIPQHRTQYRMNFWHTNNWAVETNTNAIERPLHPYELEVDWMSYDPMKK